MNGRPSTGQHRAESRLRGFRWHLVGYAIAMVLILAANYLIWPGEPWFIWPMVGWGAVLAIHVAYVMGLFDRE